MGERERGLLIFRCSTHISHVVSSCLENQTSIVKFLLAQAQQATISSPFAACSKDGGGIWHSDAFCV